MLENDQHWTGFRVMCCIGFCTSFIGMGFHIFIWGFFFENRNYTIGEWLVLGITAIASILFGGYFWRVFGRFGRSI